MKKSLLFLLLLITVLSCSKETDNIIITQPQGRTVLVYLAGNHNLSNEVHDIHDALIEGWNPKTMGELVILGHSKNDDSPMLIKLKEHQGKTVSDTVRRYPNMSSASPELLRQVISDTQIIAPGDSYGMILFSHATGWLPEKAYRSPDWMGSAYMENQQIVSRSIFQDDDGRGKNKRLEMELADFAAAIPDGMFEFIASEMCFMAGVETTYALRKKTNYIVASAPEVTSPGFIPVYPSSLGFLYKQEPDLKGFAEAFFYHIGIIGEYKSAAISVIRTSEVESLAALTREISPQLSQEQIDQIQYYERFGKPYVFFDFGDYIRKAATPEQMAQMEVLLDKAVIFKIHTEDYHNIKILKHSGLSVYIPQDGLSRLNDAYLDTDWAKAIKRIDP